MPPYVCMQEKVTDQFFNKAGTSPQTKLGTYDMLLVRMVADVLQVLSVQVCPIRSISRLQAVYVARCVIAIKVRQGKNLAL